MLLKKGAVCTWIAPEENNEEISYIWEKSLCNESCNLALRTWNSSSCWEPTQGLCITESSHWGCLEITQLETDPQKRWISLSLSTWLLASFRLWNLTIFPIMVISHLFLLKMDI